MAVHPRLQTIEQDQMILRNMKQNCFLIAGKQQHTHNMSLRGEGGPANMRLYNPTSVGREHTNTCDLTAILLLW
jgi:hypothetical protein